MRLDTRLQYAEFTLYDVRHLVLLPRKQWVTKLVVKHYHEKGHHNSGTIQTLYLLSSKYWIIAAREQIIEWEKECATCKGRKVKNAEQIMAPLPANCLMLSLRSFKGAAVDFKGPVLTNKEEVNLDRNVTCVSLLVLHYMLFIWRWHAALIPTLS